MKDVVRTILLAVVFFGAIAFARQAPTTTPPSTPAPNHADAVAAATPNMDVDADTQKKLAPLVAKRKEFQQKYTELLKEAQENDVSWRAIEGPALIANHLDYAVFAIDPETGKTFVLRQAPQQAK